MLALLLRAAVTRSFDRSNYDYPQAASRSAPSTQAPIWKGFCKDDAGHDGGWNYQCHAIVGQLSEGLAMHGAIAVAEQIGPQSATNGRWYVLLTTTGVERRTCIWMRLRGLEPYWARYRVNWREFQARSGIQWRSVLPGYLFLPHPADCKMVEDAPGVRRFLRNGDGKPKTLDEHEIGQIREIEAALNDSIIAARDGIPFKVGQLVDIKKLEKRGKILRLDGRRRIIIEVFMFNRFVTGTFSVADIEAV